jgi:hypothetical protein
VQAGFTALPVGQGDAFLLSSAAFSALIDGGRSHTTLPALFSEHRRGRALEVVVCTHNDADHAEGLIGLLASRKIKIGQMWLPGQWTTRLDDLLVAPEAFLLEVLHDIDALSEDRRQRPLTELADAYGDADTVGAEGPAIVDVMDEAIEASVFRPGRRLRHLASWWALWFHPFHRMGPRLFWEAIDAAERIRKLAYLAWHQAAAVRWFDVTSSPATTTTEPLSPVNAKEIVYVPRYRPGALEFLALSVSNKRSLCFEFRPTSKDLGVLLTADSDLKFAAPIRWSKGMIVTAPHHGSEANSHAYDRATRESSFFQSIRWVRSDGRFRSRPGAAYLRQAQRYCTRCRPYSHMQQAVRFTATASGWITKSTQRCRCV